MNKSKTYITTYCGQPLTLYELKNGKITYYTLNKVTGGVLNNISDGKSIQMKGFTLLQYQIHTQNKRLLRKSMLGQIAFSKHI